ncbi:hypothetical protein, partial [Verrucomicrobium spinosum]|uniref:hypothetical protein n=1 Tax=Verrucomicrobium spinosum TaxID=2736 RepID=UPI001C44D4C8
MSEVDWNWVDVWGALGTKEPGMLGERTHPAYCLRHLAANVSQRMTSCPTDVEVLVEVGRKLKVVQSFRSVLDDV